MDSQAERFAASLERLEAAVYTGPGDVTSETRQSVREPLTGDGPLEVYVNKVHQAAYKVIDEEIAALKADDYSDEALFEITLAAAVGAGLSRHQKALKLLEGGES
jgi:hypothetical protein